MEDFDPPDQAPRRRKNPFIVLPKRFEESKDPLIKIFNKLQALDHELESVSCWTRWMNVQMATVDAAPGHDTELDAKFVETICARLPRLYNLMILEREVTLSVGYMQSALDKVQGHCRGALSCRSEDQVRRQMEDSKHLLQEIGSEIDEYTPPNQPYLIRQEVTACLARSLSFLIDLFAELQPLLAQIEMDDEIKAVVATQEELLRELTRQADKLRDNPSQHITLAMQTFDAELQAVYKNTSEFKAEIKAECRRKGYKFYSRAGQEV